jgi:hypothetical protein
MVTARLKPCPFKEVVHDRAEVSAPSTSLGMAGLKPCLFEGVVYDTAEAVPLQNGLVE